MSRVRMLDSPAPEETRVIAGIPIEFILFALTLLGVAVFHHHTLAVALSGLAAITLYKVAFTGFKTGAGLGGLALHLEHEWVILTNLLCLLLGFALLSRHFEDSKVPAVLPHYLPDDWKGGLVLLVFVFVLSSFLDNIAAALIGGAAAHTVFRGKVHIGYLAGIVAASNAGGSGSVVGDTTTTMMWIDGVDPLDVLHAYVAALAAMLVFGVPAALQQQRYSPIIKDAKVAHRIDWIRVAVVAFILATAIVPPMSAAAMLSRKDESTNTITSSRKPPFQSSGRIFGISTGRCESSKCFESSAKPMSSRKRFARITHSWTKWAPNPAMPAPWLKPVNRILYRATTTRPPTATRKVWSWKNAMPARIAANSRKSTGTGPSITGFACMAADSSIRC